MEDKQEKFTRLANQRVNKAMDQLRLVGNLGNRAAYDYTEEDAKKIVKALRLFVNQFYRLSLYVISLGLRFVMLISMGPSLDHAMLLCV